VVLVTGHLVVWSYNNLHVVRSDNMARYRTTQAEFQAILESPGILWEHAILEKIVSSGRLPDHSMDHLPLSDCDIGTFEWDLPDEV